MPCKKCNDGKVKWGETGECEYETIQECEDANPDYSNYEEMKSTKIVELVIFVWLLRSPNAMPVLYVKSIVRKFSITTNSWILFSRT